MSANTTTKITGLNGMQTDALKAAQAESIDLEQGLTVTRTTATFKGTGPRAALLVKLAQDALAVKHGRRGHPVQSLHAVVRKFDAVKPETPTDAERAEAITAAREETAAEVAEQAPAETATEPTLDELATEPWATVRVSINGDEEFNQFVGPVSACEREAAAQEALKIPGQTRTARVVRDAEVDLGHEARKVEQAERKEAKAAEFERAVERASASVGVLVIREAYTDMPAHVVLCPSRADVPAIVAKLIPGAVMSGSDQYDVPDGPGGFADWFSAGPVV